VKVVCIANQKGGVGKTTTAINLGAALVECGYEVMVVDIDPQGNASTGLGVSRETRARTVSDVLLDGLPLADAIAFGSLAGLSLVPSTTELASADMEIMKLPRRASLLRNAIMGLEHQPDYVLIDCPPALNLLTVNALVAADAVLVPLQSEFFALEGLSQLMLTIREVRGSANPALRIEGIVMTMFDGRNKLSVQVDADVRDTLGDLVYRTRIPRNVRLSEAPSHGQPVTVYDPTSRGSIAYRSLAREFLERGGQSTRAGRRDVELT
jgi:chromosome partitioning protein